MKMTFRTIQNRYQNIPVQIKASFWFLICAFLQKGISSITTPIFTRLLTTEEYGRFSVFNSWMTVLTVFISLNLYSGMYSQGLIKFDKERKEFISSLQGLCLTLAVLWTVIYIPFRAFWNHLLTLTTIQVLSMIILIWLTAVFNFWAMEKRVELNYRKLVVLTLTVSLLRPALGIILVLHADDKVTARILGMVLVDLIAYTGLFLLQMFRGKKFFSAKFWKYALLFNIPLIPHYLSTSLLNNADRIMISRMVGDNEAGIYSLAYSVSLIMTMFNSALLQTVEPWLYQKIKDKQLSSMAKVAYPSFAIIAGVNIALIAFAPEIVAIFAPPAYYDAIWVIPPVAMSVYFMFAYNFFAVFEFYYEKTKYITFATLVNALSNIILNYVFIRLCGYKAAGYTTLFCFIFYAVFHYCFMRKVCNDNLNGEQPYSLKILILMTAVFIVSGSLFLVTYDLPIIRYVLILIFLILILYRYKYIVTEFKRIIDIRKK